MKLPRKTGIGGTAGTAAVEFALVLPMLLILVLGTVQVGFLILSHASMNATMARVPDLVRGARDVADLENRLDVLAGLPVGLGLAVVTFDPVVETCICPADAPRIFKDENTQPRPCDVVFCAAGADALRFYTVIGRIRVPSLLPGDDIGVRSTSAQLMIMGQ